MAKHFDKDPLLVAVGSPDNPRSSVWRLWVQDDEVYFGPLSMVSSLKVSLHNSGDWRIAWVKPPQKLGKNSSRIIKKWTRPDTSSGLTHCVAVYVPPVLVPKPFAQKSISDRRIIWMPPSLHKATILFVGIAGRGTDLDPARFALDRLVGKRKKGNGETVFIVAHERDYSETLKEYITKHISETKIHYKDKPTDAFASAYIFERPSVTDNKSPPVIYEIPLGWDNVFVEGPHE